MAQRNVVWTKTADVQFAGVLQYWLDKNKSNAYPKKLIIEMTFKLIAPLFNRPTDY